ncbi:hypothetical protein PPROV_000530500 [Pycnococcus provasolii]|uniref:YhhN-like protein n=1 Tax=Pycnococcus provasolii TaxID=41880 RepID=A0A830HL65_9CHLO|nr:hypothetical protein PPROV_000530500 [Pycnococcus provasolii]
MAAAASNGSHSTVADAAASTMQHTSRAHSVRSRTLKKKYVWSPPRRLALTLSLIHASGIDARLMNKLASYDMLLADNLKTYVPLLLIAIKCLPALLLAYATPRRARITAVALIACALGDLALAIDDLGDSTTCGGVPVPCFLLGLGAFLIGHGAFAAAVVLASHNAKDAKLSAIGRTLTNVPWSVLGAVLGAYIVNHAPKDLQGPVSLYCGAISLMATCALRYHASVTKADAIPARLAHAGAAFFVLSDTILGLDRFVPDSPYLPFAQSNRDARRLWIMLTYYGAIFLLAESARYVRTAGANATAGAAAAKKQQ